MNASVEMASTSDDHLIEVIQLVKEKEKKNEIEPGEIIGLVNELTAKRIDAVQASIR